MAPRFRVVALGGTFDRLHLGHEALLRAAFTAGRRVLVGVTTDRYLSEHPKSSAARLRPFRSRSRTLRAYLGRTFPGRSWELTAIGDRYGRAVGPGIDALVVSAETVEGASAVNVARRERGLPPLPVVVVPLVLADDLLPVSSSRVRQGTIDARGRRRSPVNVAVAGTRPADRAGADRAVRAVFPRARLHHPRPGTPRTGRPATLAGSLARRGLGRSELSLGIARSGDRGWFVVFASRRTALRPRFVPGRSSAELSLGLRRLLAPGHKQAL